MGLRNIDLARRADESTYELLHAVLEIARRRLLRIKHELDRPWPRGEFHEVGPRATYNIKQVITMLDAFEQMAKEGAL